MSSTDSNNSGSDIEDYYFERQLCHIDWGVGEKFDGNPIMTSNEVK